MENDINFNMLNGLFQLNIELPGDNEIMCPGDLIPDSGCKNSLCNKIVCDGPVSTRCSPQNALHKCPGGVTSYCAPTISVSYKCEFEVCCAENTNYKKS